jgi:hypothetical protein
MRGWDVNPGYLNRQGSLGEHRDIHAVVSVLTDGKTGYARHPETRHWAKALWALNGRSADQKWSHAWNDGRLAW